MKISALEQDLLGDLAADTHGLWEVFEFVRLHSPESSEQEIFSAGRALVVSWLQRDWLEIAPDPLYPSSVASIEDVVPTLDRVGLASLSYFADAPSISLTERAAADVPWLANTR